MMRESPIDAVTGASSQDLPADDPYQWIAEATRVHRQRHQCGAYTFTDGRRLLALTRRLRPDRVLELGAALGYSACCWADAGAHVDTIDRDDTHVAEAQKNVERAGAEGSVTVHLGDFDSVLTGLDDDYDVAFFDGFTPTRALLEAMLSRVRRPGLLVVANLTLAGPELEDQLAAVPGGELVPLDADVAAVALA